MLTAMTVVHPRNNPAQSLVFNMSTISTAPYQIRDIEGLGPVAASLTMEPYALSDGEQLTNTSVGKRNMVFRLGFNPNYANGETVSSLRQELYKFFIPRQKLLFGLTDSDIGEVTITGWVETVEPALFTQDPEVVISVICPDPYFLGDTVYMATGPVLQGLDTQSPYVTIDYTGTVPTGFVVDFIRDTGTGSTVVDLEFISRGFQTDEKYEIFKADDVLFNATNGARLDTNDGSKNLIRLGSGGSLTSTKLLYLLNDNSVWPKLYPGVNYVFARNSFWSQSVVDWTLSYTNRYGGL